MIISSRSGTEKRAFANNAIRKFAELELDENNCSVLEIETIFNDDVLS